MVSIQPAAKFVYDTFYFSMMSGGRSCDKEEEEEEEDERGGLDLNDLEMGERGWI